MSARETTVNMLSHTWDGIKFISLQTRPRQVLTVVAMGYGLCVGAHAGYKNGDWEPIGAITSSYSTLSDSAIGGAVNWLRKTLNGNPESGIIGFINGWIAPAVAVVATAHPGTFIGAEVGALFGWAGNDLAIHRKNGKIVPSASLETPQSYSQSLTAHFDIA